MWHKFYSNAQFQLSKDFGIKCIHGMLFWHHILFFIPVLRYQIFKTKQKFGFTFV